EGLNDVDTMVFDKTGTITKGTFKVTDIIAYNGLSSEEVLKLAAYGEAYSNHPIGISIIDAYGDKIDEDKIEDYKEIAGKGIQVKIEGESVFIGNKKLFDDNGIVIEEIDSIGTV